MTDGETSVPVSEGVFLDVLVTYASVYRYTSFGTPVVSEQEASFLVPHDRSIIRFLPIKSTWHLFELLPFHGEDFVYAVTRSLCRRAPTENELERYSAYDPWKRLDFILELNDINVRKKNKIYVIDVRQATFIWRLTRWLSIYRVPILSRRSKSYYRKYATRLFAKEAALLVNQRLLYACLDGIDEISKKMESL